MLDMWTCYAYAHAYIRCASAWIVWVLRAWIDQVQYQNMCVRCAGALLCGAVNDHQSNVNEMATKVGII